MSMYTQYAIGNRQRLDERVLALERVVSRQSSVVGVAGPGARGPSAVGGNAEPVAEQSASAAPEQPT